LPGDTCEISVEVDGKKVSYPGFFRYKIEASVTTIAGAEGVYSPQILEGPLEKCRFSPIYMGMDSDDNLFLGVDAGIAKFNLAENECTQIASGDFFQRAQMNATPDGVIMVGAEGTGYRDFFYAMDPKEGWVAKPRYIRKWILNGYPLPGTTPEYPYDNGDGLQNSETHHHCLWCYADGHLYTRYNDGQIVKINPETWEAKIVYQSNPGTAYGMAFHPIRQTELWLVYEDGLGGTLSDILCSFDVTDSTSFRALSRSGGGHRDGPLAEAMFHRVRQINFDYEGNLYIGDSGNHCIRKVDTETMMVETTIGIPGLAGYTDGNKDEAQFRDLHGIVTDSEGVIYASDWGNKVVRRIAIE
jgi:outer membrane protein assembly factor BamB